MKRRTRAPSESSVVRAAFTALAAAAGATVALGCGGEDGEAPAFDPVALELGTGEAVFASVKPDAEVPIIAGAQGGFHIWVSVRGEGLPTGRYRMHLEATVPGTELPPAESTVTLSFVEAPGLTMGAEFVGWPAVLPSPGCAAEHGVQVDVTLRTLDRALAGEGSETFSPTAAPPVPTDCVL